ARVAQVVLAAPAGLELGEHVPQRGAAEPAQRLRAQGQPFVAARDPALAPQLPFELLQPPHVVGRAPPELPLDRLHVDVVQRRPRVLLTELVEQVVEVAELLERAGRLAVAELALPTP